MAEDSKIEWTDHTFNPWWGCTSVSPACKHCYAEALAKRWGHNVWGKHAPRRVLSDENWTQPLSWNDAAFAAGTRARVFCASMADVFEDRRDLDHSRARLWQLIRSTPRLDWQLLTKRPEHVMRLSPWGMAWPDNVWIGTTVEDQRRANERLRHLTSIPASVRFISSEPLLGALDLTSWIDRLDWVIAGGESGASARPSAAKWFRSLRDQCRRADVPFFFKQWGVWAPHKQFPNARRQVITAHDGREMIRIGKAAAGRLLGKRTWEELPFPKRLR